MSEKGNKSNIVNNFRKFFEEKSSGNINPRTIKEFLNNLKWLCKGIYYNYYNEEDCNEITQKVFVDIYSYGKEIWQETQIDNDTNNKRIYGYLRTTMANSVYRIKDDLYQEKNKIRKHVKNALAALVDEGFLSYENGKYSLATNNAKDEDCLIDDIIEYFPIFKGKQIKSERVIALLKKIFTEYLENCEVNDSDIKEVFLKFVIYSNIYQAVIVEEINDDSEQNKITVQEHNDFITDKIETTDLIMIWINRVRKILEDKFEIYGKLFLFHYYGKITLEEIANQFGISKSSVDNYIKKFIASMSIDDDIEPTEFPKYQNLLFTILSKELNVDLED